MGNFQLKTGSKGNGKMERLAGIGISIVYNHQAQAQSLDTILRIRWTNFDQLPWLYCLHSASILEQGTI